ncbi:caspase family protein [Nocardia pseudobrasiliensis]|uniref:WD40 repeat protein n=1 Tax=Nocardia pseudobrasiliensis TaxID=45979 RepID=A0A370IDH4_9NOCA|nr:caspase family protein [Nocardia pseudobrasiliensis]RDI68191.1 WD40 repeat protein [Nocardia pseudobrasiliensis]
MADPPVLVAVGTQHYAREDLAALDRVPNSLAQIVETLRALGISPVEDEGPGYLLDVDRARLFAALRGAVDRASVVIVYYTGHGVQFNNKYYLPLTSTRSDLPGTAIATRELLEDYFLRLDEYGEPAAEQPTVLVIFDCCFSTSALIEGMHSLLQGIGNANLWVMASADTVEYAQDGAFAKALSEYLRNPRTGPSQRYLSLEILVGEINSAIARAGIDQEARWFPPARRGVTGLLPFFPNPGFQPHVAGFTIDEQRHWPEFDGFYLTGRDGRIRALEDLAEFLTGSGPGIAVVTGSPGSGKSTLLALPAQLSATRTREELLRTGLRNPLILRAGALLPEELEVVGVHARGLNTDQVAAAIAGSLGVPGATANAVLTELVSAKDSTTHRVVVDAIDESVTPADLLEFLRTLPKVARIRVGVGMRGHLLDRLAAPDLVIDLDAARYRDRTALISYVRQLLVAAFEPGVTTAYRDAEEAATIVVAESIAAKASTAQTDSFFIARSLALAVRSRAEPIGEVPASVAAAFDEDLGRFGPRAEIARILLAALAWAKGPGLPWENVWVPVARAIAAVRGGPAIDDDDVRWLLRHAGSYIIEDVGPGDRSVFRPFHELLAAHLRGDDPAAGIGEQIVRALLAQARATGSWRDAHPYIRTYLAEHARDAGAEWVEVLLAEADYPAVADPAILTPVLSALAPDDPMVRSYRRASPLLTDDCADNLAHLAEAAAALVADPELFAASTLTPTYRTVRVWAARDDSVLAFRAHRSSISDIAFGADPGGRPLLVTITRGGDEDEVWDVRTGRPLGDPAEQDGELRIDAIGMAGTREFLGADRLIGVDNRLLHIRRENLALVVTDARTEEIVSTIRVPVALGSWTRAILNARTLIRDFQDVFGGSLPLAVGSGVDDRLLLATGDRRGLVRLFAVDSGAEVGQLAGESREMVVALAFSREWSGDSHELAVVHRGGEIHCWDLVGRRVRATAHAGEGHLTAIDFGISDDVRTFMIGYGDGRIRIDGRVLRGHSEAVNAVALPGSGSSIAASADARGTVRVWDLGSESTPPGRGDEVPRLAIGSANHLAIGTDSGEVRVMTTRPDRQWSICHRHSAAIAAIAFGSGPTGPLLATADTAGQVRLFDVDGRSLVTQSVRVDGTVEAIGCGTLASGLPFIAVAQQWPGEVRVWRIDAKGRAHRVTRRDLPRPDIRDHLTIEALTGSPTGEVLALTTLRPPTSDPTTLTLWNITTGEQLSNHTFTRRPTVAFATAPDGRPIIAATAENEPIQTWDALTATPLWNPLPHNGSAQITALNLTWTPDNRPLLTTGDNTDTIQILDPLTHHPLTTIHRRSTPKSVALTADILCVRDGDGLAMLRVADVLK